MASIEPPADGRIEVLEAELAVCRRSGKLLADTLKQISGVGAKLEEENAQLKKELRLLKLKHG